MTDSLSPLFADRTMRLSVLPDEQRLAFETLEKNSGDPAFADRQFSALWMSKRTGLPQEEVLKNFDGLAARYFGEGTTPSQAYDRIAATYKPQAGSGQGEGGENAPEAKESALMAGGTVIAKDVAGSFAGGASRMGYDSLGGFYSNLAAVTGVTMKRPQDDPEYQALSRSIALQDDPLAFSRVYSEPSGFGGIPDEVLIEQDRNKMQVISDRIQAENMAALEAATGTFSKNYSDNAREIATTMYELSKGSLDAYGVRSEFQDTAVGQLVATAGSLPVTALYATLGPYLGAGAIYTGIYGQVEQERMETEGRSYDPQAAFMGNLVSAGPQAALEFAFGMERVMGKIISISPKVGGKIAFGDAARLMAKTGLVSGTEEALTEPAQGFWNDWAASLTYDEKRELLSEDVLKQRIVESASAFALGFLFGGGVQGVQLVDRNRASAKAERYLTTRDGNLLEAPDFAALRSAKTDDELRAMAGDPSMADTLVAAANGNVEAQAAYRQETLSKAFVDTDGLAAQGFSIGKVGEMVAIRDGSGRITTIDPADPVASTFLKEVQGEAIAVAEREATEATIAQAKSRFGETLEIESAVESPTLREMVDAGAITLENAEDALATAKAINGLAEYATLETARRDGRAVARVDASGTVKMAVQLAQGKDPTLVVEEVAEAWKHKAVKDGKLDPAELTEARKKWHKDNGEADPTEGGKVSASRADTEWFSKRVIDYALANRKTELPDGWSKWLRAIGDRLRELLKGAAKMKKLMRDGKLDPKLESWFQAALGGEQLAEPAPSAAQQVPMLGERGGVMSTFSLAYREMSPYAALEFISPASSSDMTMKEVFLASTPELATGQGDNKGVRVELETSGLNLKKATSKPGMAFSAAVGGGQEFVARLNDQEAYQNAVKAFEFTKDIAKMPQGRVIISVAKGLEAKGWKRTEANGVTRMERPSEQGGIMSTFSLEDVTFAITGIPQTKQQQLQRTFNQIHARQAALFPYPYQQLAASPVQAKVSLGGHEAGLAGRVLLPVSERLRFIADKSGQRIGILTRVRRYYSEKGTNLRRYSDQVTPLMRGIARMNTTDLDIFKVAASNQDALMRDSIIAKYGLQNEWAAYEAARDALRTEMIAAGMDVGDIGEYFPRWVTDVTGLRQSMGVNASDGVLEKAVIEAEKSAGRPLRDEEVNAIIDGAVRGVSYGAKGGSAPSNTKQRKIVVIQPNQRQYYADPNQALSRWLNQSTEAIARYRFFGKAAQQLTPQQVLAPTQSDLDVSIGTILAEEVASGNLPATAQAEVKAMLDGLFSYHGSTNAFIRGFMDLSYWATMGKLSSALAQATDLMVSVYEAGPWNTFAAIPEAVWRNAKALPGIGNSKTFSEAVANFTKGKDWLTREQLGIDRIMEEFNDQRFTTRALNQVFTATGLNFMDGIGKDVLLNAKFRQMTKQATKGQLSASNKRMLEGIFGKAKASQVVADFATNQKNADTIFAVYNVLADWQPISLAEYPEAYAKNPNARVLYMLKSYSIKMLAAYRREGLMKLWWGSAEQKREGARNLAYLLALLFMAGASKDWLVDFLLDRDPQMEDIMVDNIFKLMQVSRYAIWQQRNRATDEGIYGGVSAAAEIAGNIKQIGVDLIAPPFTLIERPMKDVKAWAKAAEDYEPWTFYESESIQFIPVAGEFLYWTGPTGQGKIERRRALRENE
jgi:hypothetical protein